MNEDLDVSRFEGDEPGENLTVFGGIHGNEKAGPKSIAEFKKALRNKNIILRKGSVTLVEVANPEAFALDRRFIDENLNRVFKKHAQPKTYEQHLANRLTALIPGCDDLLDLHTQTSKADPFVFVDFEDEKTFALAKALGTKIIFTHWPDLYANSDDVDTTKYAHDLGKTALVIECGQHKDPHAPNVAFNAIVNSLAHLKMIDQPVRPPSPPPQIIHAIKKYDKPACGGHFTQAWQHLQEVSMGQELAVSNDGDSIRAIADGVIIMPNENDSEWLYLGRRVEPTAP